MEQTVQLSIKITGLEDLKKWFDKAPDMLFNVIGKALSNSIAMVETESKRRTPVDTGLLQSSIGGQGGTQGYSFVRGLTAGVGTNVNYAIYVHEGRGRHKVGERKFMEKGLQASAAYIESEFEKALNNLVNSTR